MFDVNACRFGVFCFIVLPGCAPQAVTPQSAAIVAVAEKPAVQISEPYSIEMSGNQFRWLVRYPGADGILRTADDVLSQRDVHIPVGITIDLKLKSNDYVYLLSLPEFRAKEVAVPTLEFSLQFRAEDIGEYTLDGDEFCGDPHPELKGRLFVESIEQFQDWIRHQPVGADAKIRLHNPGLDGVP